MPFAGVGVPGLYQGGIVPGTGFGGRGVLPGVATGTDLNPKSIGGQQGGLGPGTRGFGGPMQPGVFHGYPLKSPKVQGVFRCFFKIQYFLLLNFAYLMGNLLNVEFAHT
ncbi:hypothetical protein ATANTOWER_028762 [Ataeniobius toweri]|uniref:Elastin n=1 Tax=Ataeniobius toweri TaxID=208326 RepID=A0ABU7ATQ8_9TELE|nr:hypothetical protein [Ataeniobius toweri]